MIESRLLNEFIRDNRIFRARFSLTDAVKRNDHAHGNHLLYGECPSYMLIAAANRHGHLVIDGRVCPLSPEKVYVVSPGPRVEIDYPASGKQSLFLFQFAISAPDGTPIMNSANALAADLCPELMSGFVSSSERLLMFCGKIIDHWNTDDQADRFASQSGFQDLLHLLLKKPQPHENVLEQVREYMEQHYSEAVTVEDLARLAGMSRYYFMRSFKDRFGQSAMEYLTDIRINRAKQYMEEGGTLSEIAERVGYKDSQYFSSQFNKYVGVPPTIYTANRSSKIAAYSWPNIGHLLTLQIIPYAAPIDQSWTDEYRRKYHFDVKVPLSHDYDFNREALWRARPDKIIALEEMIPDEEKARLREIAPVLFLPWHQATWRVHLQMTAQFLEREKEGNKWLSRYDEKAAAVKRSVPAAFRQGSLLIVNFSSKGIKVWGRRAGTVLYDDLDIAYAKGVEQIRFTEFVPAERLEAFEADLLLIHVMKDPVSAELWNKTQSSPVWQHLKAVRNGRVYLTSSPAWVAEPILEYTAYRHDHLLDELQQVFSAL